MLNITISIEAYSECDVECAVQEVRRLLLQGYRNGFGENDSGSYEFSVEGEEEEVPEDEETTEVE